MKNFIALILLIVLNINCISLAQTIFTQDFDSSSILSNYFNSSPTTNQFRAISANGGASVDIVSNALQMAKNTGTTAYAERNVDFSTVPTGMVFKFDLTVSGGAAATSAMIIYVGGDISNSSAIPSNSNVYARLAINTTSTSGEFVVRDITNTTNGANTYSGTKTITWVLNNTGASKNYTGPDASTEPVANDAADIWVGTTKEFNDISIQTASQTLARFKFLASSWENNTTITIDNIVIQNESVLPVELTSFSAVPNANSVQLNWQTATEFNNYGFEVERKIPDQVLNNNLEWMKIGFVPGHGNSNTSHEYSFIDKNPVDATSFYYRLKQIDVDGKYEYSDALFIKLNVSDKAELLQNSPNPFNPSTSIKFYIPFQSDVKIKVYDLLGREVTTLINKNVSEGYHIVFWNGSDKYGEEVASGIYLYRLTAGSFVETKKMILMK